MPTPTEKRIIQERRNAASGAVLVPLLETLLEKEVIPEDDQDFAFLDMLMRVRATPREKGVFSPSMLGSCIRQAYFSKRGEKKHLSHNPQTNGYFLKGNFVHFQWQFAMWKAQRAGLLSLLPINDQPYQFYSSGLRPGVEVRVVDGDFGGTIDVICTIDKKHYIVDFKGINLIDYNKTVKKGAPVAYRRQLVGYAKIAEKVLGIEIEACLLISESKAGPVSGNNSPLALHETRVPIVEFEGDVRRRLRTLKWFDSHDEMPPPECVSTRHMSFQECPFNRFCQDEVRAAQRIHERKARLRAGNLRVARSGTED